ALHKSVRNSDVDAALYWLGRMLEAGEDPLYIARRVVRMAVEDIGLADPQALSLCMAARDAVDFIGMPEGNLALAQAVVYLSVAPKSNALYTAYSTVQVDVERTAAQPVPLHLRNAPTSLMKNIGYGQGYQYAHDLESKVADMQCLPGKLKDREYYSATNEGVEARFGGLHHGDQPRCDFCEFRCGPDRHAAQRPCAGIAEAAESGPEDQLDSRSRPAHRQNCQRHRLLVRMRGDQCVPARAGTVRDGAGGCARVQPAPEGA